LHALADASFPQHIAGTTGYGHRPLEDAINEVYPDALSTLTAGSAAINAGVLIPGITDDVTDAKPDEGAFEYGAAK